MTSIDPATGGDPRPASQPRYQVETLRDVRVPVRDGLELSANLWLPLPAADHPDERFPVILEMIPYRKDDWRWATDESRGRWFAARGYALCRLDVRGTGSSPGIAIDEYAELEILDGYDAVEWLATRPWCSGSVGMWGISYGGFTAIQVAKLAPPHLQAIAPMYASDDRYLDDVHYVGGCVTASELSQYAVSMVGSNALPARPGYRGTEWEAEWRDRLDRTPVWLFEWLRRQHDGPYWRQGSLAPDHVALTVPCLLIGGWMDSYVDPVFRMLERCVNAPRRAIVGNWVHAYPDDAYPGPSLDWLHEMVRFFDRWLKGMDNGDEREPALTWYEREFALPEPFPATWPGRWRGLPSWPPPGATSTIFHLAGGDLPLDGRLVPPGTTSGAEPGSDRFAHRATTGTGGSLSWGAGPQPNGLARDTRSTDALIPIYTSRPLDEALSILGSPEAVLSVETTMPVATLFIRLSDVAPDGTASQVTAGALNLTHRDSHAAPEPLAAGRRYTVRVPLRSAGYRFAAGHRIRLSVASNAWPILWPSPFTGEIVIHREAGASRLVLPSLPADRDLVRPTAFKTSPAGLPEVGAGSTEVAPTWRIAEDVLAGTVTVTTAGGDDTTLPDGTRVYEFESLEMTASDVDPATAWMRTEVVYRLDQDGRAIEVRADGLTTSTATEFEMSVELAIQLDGQPFHQGRWSEKIPRRLV